MIPAADSLERDASLPEPLVGVGGQWIVDASGCEADRLTSIDGIDAICAEVIESLGLQVVGQRQAHRFGPPHGVTVLYLLSESHLACHTYPEHGLVTFNLVCCRHAAPWPWESVLRARLGAQHVEIRHLHRGVWR